METAYTIAYLSIQKLEQGRLACTVGSHQSYTGLQINSKVKVLIDERLHTQHTATSQQAVDLQNKRTQLMLKVGLSNSALTTIT